MASLACVLKTTVTLDRQRMTGCVTMNTTVKEKGILMMNEFKVCPDCQSGNVHPEECCGNVACVECGWQGHRSEMECPGHFLDGQEITRGEER